MHNISDTGIYKFCMPDKTEWDNTGQTDILYMCVCMYECVYVENTFL